MPLRRITTPLLFALLVGGCAEMTAPLDDAGTEFARDGNRRSTKTTQATANDETLPLAETTEASSPTETDSGTEATSPTSDAWLPANTVEQAGDAPELMTYHTSFLAVQGQKTMWNLYYRDPSKPGEVGDHFVYVEIPADAQLLNPDGTPAAYGERVEITVDVDPVSFFVEFGPHGSQFDGRVGAQLWFNYQHANTDGHDNDVPTIWYQPDAGETWEDQSIQVARRGKWLYLEIKHFSNYAVAW